MMKYPMTKERRKSVVAELVGYLPSLRPQTLGNSTKWETAGLTFALTFLGFKRSDPNE
jgi:hypothetical protein